MKHKCTKKIYSASEAERETVRLQGECRAYGWFHAFCRTCRGFHVVRTKKGK